MTLRDWIADRLDEDENGRPTGVVDVRLEAVHGLRVTREDMPTAYIYCADPDAEPFSPADLDEAIEEIPRVQFIVVARRQIHGFTFGHADARGIAVGGLKALQFVLGRYNDIGSYKSSTHEYVQRQFTVNRFVDDWRRVGYDAYEIDRPNGLRTLTVITLNPYEVTQEQALRLIEEHSHVEVDGLVNTNPSCNGFSSETLAAADNAGVEILRLSEFLPSLGDPWED